MPRSAQLLSLHGAVVDLRRRVVYRDGVTTSLTRNEGTVLAALADARGAAVDARSLLARLGYGTGTRTKTLGVTVRRVRTKIERDPSRPVSVQTVRGAGYRLDVRDVPEAMGLVGRADVLEACAAHLGASRCVTLLGAAGVGKSRLGRVLAGLHRGAYTGGVVAVELSRTRDSAAVPALVGAALGVWPTGRTTSWRDAVERVLADAAPVLLVLDGVDGLAWDVAALVDRWLAATPALRVLATSRERLGLAKEHVERVPPLDDGAVRAMFDSLSVPTDDRLVYAAGGLPLAVELLARGARGPVPPGDPMAGALWSSWTSLSRAEQELLARCSVFEAPFPVDAAAALVSGASAVPVAAMLARLVDRSLLEPGPPWSLLPPVRTFVAARLDEMGNGPEVRARHADWHADRAAELVLTLREAGDADALEQLRALLPELRAVVDRPDASAAAALAVAVALDVDARLRGPTPPYVALLDRVLARPGAPPRRIAEAYYTRARSRVHQGQMEAALRDLDTADAHSDDVELRTRVVEERARIAGIQGDSARGVAMLEAARLAARQRRDRPTEARVTLAIGIRRLLGGDEGGTADLRRALHQHERLHLPTPTVRRYLAFAEAAGGDGPAALKGFTEALREASDPYQAALIRWGRLLLRCALDDLDATHDDAAACEAVFARVDSPVMLADIVSVRAQIHLARGDLDAAEAGLERAEAVAHDLPGSTSRALRAYAWARLADERGDRDGATAGLAEVARLLAAVAQSDPRPLRDRALLAHLSGDPAGALAEYTTAAEGLRTTRHRAELADTCLRAAVAARALGHDPSPWVDESASLLSAWPAVCHRHAHAAVAMAIGAPVPTGWSRSAGRWRHRVERVVARLLAL